MKVNHNIIKDLAPIYLSGEASEDTIKFVDNYLELNQDLKFYFKNDLFEQNINTKMISDQEMDLIIMTKTKKNIQFKSIILGLAVFMFSSSFIITGDSNSVKFFMWTDAPEFAIPLFSLSIVLFIWYYKINKKASQFLSY